MQLDTRQLEQLRPECDVNTVSWSLTMEQGDVVQMHHLIEEDARHRSHRVGVPQRNEMCKLGEVIDDGEDNQFAAHLGKPLDKVHRDVLPHRSRHRQGLEKTGRM